MTWHWPQFVYAALVAVHCGACLARYGQQKRDSYDIFDVVIGPAIGLWILYMGGFWTPSP